MERIFKYLTDGEERALLEKSGKRRFEPEEVLIREGEDRNALFILRSGTALVVIDSAGFPLELSRLGPGQICGEMSFLEGVPASASVIADTEPVEAYEIKGEFIEAFLKQKPAFFGRFYKSLAEILSRRLRDTSALVGTRSDWAPD